MNTLTEKERNGLEEVFNSIQVSNTKYSISKYLSSFLIVEKAKTHRKTFTYKLKKGMKLPKISQLLTNYVQKKKNLSK